MIEKILKEINRLKGELDGYSALEALDYIESYVNTISRELASKDLDREIGYYTTSKLLGKRNHSTGIYHLTQKDCGDIAYHFTEWQKQKSMQDFLEKAMELKKRYYNNNDASVGKPIEKQSYVLGKCNAICDVIDLLEGKPLDEIC